MRQKRWRRKKEIRPRNQSAGVLYCSILTCSVRPKLQEKGVWVRRVCAEVWGQTIKLVHNSLLISDHTGGPCLSLIRLPGFAHNFSSLVNMIVFKSHEIPEFPLDGMFILDDRSSHNRRVPMSPVWLLPAQTISAYPIVSQVESQ